MIQSRTSAITSEGPPHMIQHTLFITHNTQQVATLLERVSVGPSDRVAPQVTMEVKKEFPHAASIGRS